MGHFLSLYWICSNIASVLFMFLIFWLWSRWELSSLIRDGTCTPALEGKVLTTGLLFIIFKGIHLYPSSFRNPIISPVFFVLFCSSLLCLQQSALQMPLRLRFLITFEAPSLKSLTLLSSFYWASRFPSLAPLEHQLYVGRRGIWREGVISSDLLGGISFLINAAAISSLSQPN